MQEALDKITEGDVTLLDTLARMRLAIQAAVSDAFKVCVYTWARAVAADVPVQTPEVIGMFTKKQPGQLRQRLLQLDQAVKLRKITPEAYNEQRVEVLAALGKLGEPLDAAEQRFLEQHMSRALRDFEQANNEIGAGTQTGLLSLAAGQVKTAQAN